MEAIARVDITHARQLSFHGRYRKAFEFYILAFNKCPSIKSLFESEFRVVLIRLNEHLAKNGEIEPIFSNFAKAVDAFPRNMYLFNDIGKYLFKFGYYTEALAHFENALHVDYGFVEPEKNLNSLKNLLVERWHFRMLNDRVRNEAYHAAILETVQPGDTVLDLGTGTGLLALYAKECSPSSITGCEGSKIMAKLATTIMEENQARNIVIIDKMSTDLICHQIGGRKSVLITELFDCGLLGEHILQSLSHAFDNLLTETARVIPCKAEFFVVGVNCKHLNMKYQLQSFAKDLLNIPNSHIHASSNEEPYDCEDVHLFKDIKYMTDMQSILEVNFNDCEDIQDKLKMCEPLNVKLEVKDCGEVDTIVGWFNLHLTENIMITTNPIAENRAKAWQQAVFLDFVPRHVNQSDIIEANFLVNGGKMTLVPDSNIPISRISPETLRFLNDYDYTRKIQDCIGVACIYLGQMMEFCHVTVADMCPFPLFGLLMMKRGAESLTCSANSESDERFIKEVFKANNIPLSKIKILVGDDWDQDSFGTEKFHAIFCHAFVLCGDINLRQKESVIRHLKYECLQEEGLFLPATVHLMGQLVSSHWLDINNRVYDENVHNHKIAAHINNYQVSQNYSLDFSNLDYCELSEPTVLGKCSSLMNSDVISVPVTSDGYANAILCWYSIELMKDLGEVQTNRQNSFMNGMAFLAHPSVRVARNGFADVLRCVDQNGSFKLIIDVDNT